METQTYCLKLPSYYDSWELHFVGDIHWNHVGCDRDAVYRKINRIKSNPNARWIGMGDYNEFIGWKDPRFTARAVSYDVRVQEWSDWAQSQSEAIIKLLTPIKDQCIGLLWGNHEYSIYNWNSLGRNVVQQLLAPALETRFLGYESMLRILVQDTKRTRYTVGVYCHHGYGGGKLMGSKALTLERLPSSYDANIFAMGHTHTPIVFPRDRLVLTENGNYIRQPIMLLNTGSFLKMKQEGVEGYEVLGGFPPSSIATVYTTIRYNNRHKEGKDFNRFLLSCTIGE